MKLPHLTRCKTTAEEQERTLDPGDYKSEGTARRGVAMMAKGGVAATATRAHSCSEEAWVALEAAANRGSEHTTHQRGSNHHQVEEVGEQVAEAVMQHRGFHMAWTSEASAADLGPASACTKGHKFQY